ncbi:MAG: hypothetical protein JWM27_3340 [Gemmatimonadetes bacterium]|nr:hypothetical protein [Gemmatimonadota bacterium]
MIGDELIGAMFLNAKDLRHLAEQEFGELFVPTEVILEGDRRAMFELHVHGVGRIVIHAERERDPHPYHITRVERPRAAPASPARASEVHTGFGPMVAARGG